MKSRSLAFLTRSLEPPEDLRATLQQLPRLFRLELVGYGVVPWLFSATGPLLIMFEIGLRHDMPTHVLTAWIFGSYLVGGVLTLFFNLLYRVPVSMLWTLQGVILIGGSLAHLSFAEVLGAYMVSGLLVVAVGLTGVIHAVMERFPVGVIMGVVGGVLMPYLINIVRAMGVDPLGVGAALAGYVAASLLRRRVPSVPPVLGALIVGIAAAAFTGKVDLSSVRLELAPWQVFVPEFRPAALAELVLPLTLLTLGVSHPQGIGVLWGLGWRPPVNALAVGSGIGTLCSALLGSHCIGITGPPTALLCSDSQGAERGRYVSGLVCGLLTLASALFAPVAVSLARALPIGLIQALAGLSLLGIVPNYLGKAFTGPTPLGAVVGFAVAMSGMSLFQIGAPFWGMVFGLATAALLERDAFGRRQERVPSAGGE